MAWRVEFVGRADRQLDALDPPVRSRILRALVQLAQDPSQARNVQPLTGSDLFRLRVGDWRVIYRPDGERLVVLVVRIGHRREVYR